MEHSDFLVGLDPVLSQRFQRNHAVLRPAGGEGKVDMSIVHQSASEAVDRIFSHPMGKQQNDNGSKERD